MPVALVMRNSNMISSVSEIRTRTPTLSCDHFTSCWLGMKFMVARDKSDSRNGETSGCESRPGRVTAGDIQTSEREWLLLLLVFAFGDHHGHGDRVGMRQAQGESRDAAGTGN